MRYRLCIASLLFATTAHAQTAVLQSPAYEECTALASSNPEKALAKADAWLKIDSSVAAQHCRAMALFGLRHFAEAGDALVSTRDAITPDGAGLRTYVARQAAQAYLNANSADKALAVLGTQIGELANVRGDNVSTAKLTTSLLLDRARLNITYGKLADASKDLDHAVSLTPINEEVLIERAGVFEKLGDLPLARADIDVVLAVNPNNAVAKNAKKRLSGKETPATDLAAPAANAPVVAAPAAPAATQAAVPVAGAPATPAPVDTAVTPVSSSALSPAAAQTPALPAPDNAPAPTPALPFVAPPEGPRHTSGAAQGTVKKPQKTVPRTEATPISKPALPVPGASVAP